MEIELPDGTILEAPDGADPSVVAKNYLRKNRKPYGPKDPAVTEAAKKSRPDLFDPEYQYNPTSGMSGMQRFNAGAGKATVDLGRGIKQLALGAADIVNPRQQTLSDLVIDKPRSRYAEYSKHIDEIKRQDAPLMRTGAGLAGNLAGTIASVAIPAGALGVAARGAGLARTGAVLSNVVNPTTLRAAIAGGAAVGALQPTGEHDNRLLNSALGGAGGALGYGLSKGIGRLVNPSQSVAKPAYQKAVANLQSEGIPMDAAQVTGSGRLAQVKRMLTDNPLTNAGQIAKADDVATAFDRAALRTIGETADVADEVVMSRAASRIGGVMDAVAQRNPIKVDQPLLNDLANIASQSAKELESPQAAVIASQIDEVLNKAGNGTVDGKAYQNIRGALGRLQGSQAPGIKHWAGQLQEALNNALTRSASAADVDALKTARVQWRNLEGISKVIGSQEGQHISPAKLANALNTKGYGGKVAMVRGKGATDLMRLAKSGSTVLPDRFPQSGTAPRAALQLLLPGALGAGIGYAKEGDAAGAAKWAAGGVAAPFLLQKLLNTPGGTQYLSKGVPALQGQAAKQISGIFGPALRIAPTGLFLEAAE